MPSGMWEVLKARGELAGERVSLPVALHAQCAAHVALCGQECVYQHTVLRAGRAIQIGMCFAV